MPCVAIMPITNRSFFSGRLDRVARFASVSLAGTIGTQTILWDLVGQREWSGGPANFAAVSVVSVPAYFANRHWVWQRRRGQHSLRSEIVPYWVMAFSGLALSTLFAWLTYRVIPHAWAVSLANMAGFGMLWIVKFFVFDRYVFGPAVSIEQTPSRDD